MALKNTYSESKNTFEKIQQILARHKAKQIYFEYDDNGRVKEIAFALPIGDKVHGFRLPARVQQVEKLLNATTEKQKEQAYRTAWANIRDWLDAQMALIDTEQVKIEEVFLPYMVNREGKTVYEVMEQNDFLLPSGEKK
jgi:hypothetical protein